MQRPGMVAYTLGALVAVFLLMPLLAVVPLSFTPAHFLTMPTGRWSLTHYRDLIDNPAWAQSALLSLRIGIASSVIATCLALAFAVGIWMFQPPFASLLVGFVLLPMIVPPVVTAITLFFLLSTLSRLNDVVGFDTWIGLTLSHVVVVAPYATVLIFVALAQFDRRVDLAARNLGATVVQRVCRIILPNIRFGILTAVLLSFVLSWDEISVTLFVTSVNTVTLPRMMWMGVHDNIDPAIASVSVVLIVLTTAICLLRTAFVRGETSR